MIYVLTTDFQEVKGKRFQVINSSRNARSLQLRVDGKRLPVKKIAGFCGGECLVVGEKIEMRQTTGNMEITVELLPSEIPE